MDDHSQCILMLNPESVFRASNWLRIWNNRCIPKHVQVQSLDWRSKFTCAMVKTGAVFPHLCHFWEWSLCMSLFSIWLFHIYDPFVVGDWFAMFEWWNTVAPLVASLEDRSLRKVFWPWHVFTCKSRATCSFPRVSPMLFTHFLCAWLASWWRLHMAHHAAFLRQCPMRTKCQGMPRPFPADNADTFWIFMNNVTELT